MSYTVISMFPVSVDTDEVVKKLLAQDYPLSDISVSKIAIDGTILDPEEEEKTSSFWDYLFPNEVNLLHAYKSAGVDNNCITLYTDSVERAREAKTIFKENGAIDVMKNKEIPEEQDSEIPEGMTEDEYNGIIAKAKHNVYMLNHKRAHKPNSRGMNKRMDSFGSKD